MENQKGGGGEKEDLTTFWEGGSQDHKVPILPKIICWVSMILVKIVMGQDRIRKFS